jgi:hypothetical protein
MGKMKMQSSDELSVQQAFEQFQQYNNRKNLSPDIRHLESVSKTTNCNPIILREALTEMNTKCIINVYIIYPRIKTNRQGAYYGIKRKNL